MRISSPKSWRNSAGKRRINRRKIRSGKLGVELISSSGPPWANKKVAGTDDVQGLLHAGGLFPGDLAAEVGQRVVAPPLVIPVQRWPLVRLLDQPIPQQALDQAVEGPRPKRSADHPTSKPVELVAHCLRNSTKRGDLVFEPFAGSGSTLIACEQLGRVCRALEIDPRYTDVVVSRWEALTGQTAERMRP